MNKLVLLSAFLLASFFATAQPTISWQQPYPILSTANLSIPDHDMVIDASGNVYKTGAFQGVATFGSTNITSTIYSADIYVTKNDANGNFLWVKTIGGYFLDRAYSIALDASNNIYLAGSTGSSNADFDPSPTGTAILTTLGAFVLKLDNNGNFVWVKQFAGVASGDYGSVVGYGFKVDAAGNVYSTGSFLGSVDFDPNGSTFNITSTNGSTSDPYISKLDTNGNFVWAKAFLRTSTTGNNNGTSDFDKGLNLELDNAGNVYTMGTFDQTVDFDPGTAVYNISYAYPNTNVLYLSKLDTNGNFVWAKNLFLRYETISDFASMCADASGNIYFTGSGSSPSSVIWKLDTNGNFVWNKNIVASNSDHVKGKSIAVDAQGNVYTAGNFFGGNNVPIDFDPGTGVYNLAATGASDGFISKLDATGNFVWAKRIGGTVLTFPGSDDYCYSIALAPDGKVYYNGYAGSSFTLKQTNATVTAGGFIASYTQPVLSISQFELESNISIYPNPSSGNFNIGISEDLIGSKVSVYNVLGQIIKNFNLDQLTTNQNLDSGIYILEIEKDGSKTSKKLIVQ